jgi:hypothetical protein
MSVSVPERQISFGFVQMLNLRLQQRIDGTVLDSWLSSRRVGYVNKSHRHEHSFSSRHFFVVRNSAEGPLKSKIRAIVPHSHQREQIACRIYRRPVRLNKHIGIRFRLEIVASSSPRKNFVTVAGIEAWSKTRPSTTVPLGIHGEIRIAGTRTPRRSKANGWPVPVSLGGSRKLVRSIRQAGGIT